MDYELFILLSENIFTYQQPKDYSDILVQLAVTLRWLAGGSYLDICMSHDLPSTTKYAYIDITIDVLLKVLEIGFPIQDRVARENVSRISTQRRQPSIKLLRALD